MIGISEACKKYNIDRQAFYKWERHCPMVKSGNMVDDTIISEAFEGHRLTGESMFYAVMATCLDKVGISENILIDIDSGMTLYNGNDVLNGTIKRQFTWDARKLGVNINGMNTLKIINLTKKSKKIRKNFEALKNLKWDGIERLDNFLPFAFEDDDPQYKERGHHLIGSIMRRVITPGSFTGSPIFIRGDMYSQLDGLNAFDNTQVFVPGRPHIERELMEYSLDTMVFFTNRYLSTASMDRCRKIISSMTSGKIGDFKLRCAVVLSGDINPRIRDEFVTIKSDYKRVSDDIYLQILAEGFAKYNDGNLKLIGDK